MNVAILPGRERLNMFRYMFYVTSIVIYWHAKIQEKPEIAFPSVKEWNDSEDGMTVSRMNELMNIFGNSLFESISITAYPLLAADNRSARHDLVVHRTRQFGEEAMPYKFFTQPSPILCIRLCETVFVNVTLDATFQSVHPAFEIPQSVLLKDDATFVLGFNLLSGHFSDDFLGNQEQSTADYLARSRTRCARQPSNSLSSRCSSPSRLPS
jgi:hypothetical protein